jgi:hypothetical protein
MLLNEKFNIFANIFEFILRYLYCFKSWVTGTSILHLSCSIWSAALKTYKKSFRSGSGSGFCQVQSLFNSPRIVNWAMSIVIFDMNGTLFTVTSAARCCKAMAWTLYQARIAAVQIFLADADHPQGTKQLLVFLIQIEFAHLFCQ